MDKPYERTVLLQDRNIVIERYELAPELRSIDVQSLIDEIIDKSSAAGLPFFEHYVPANKTLYLVTKITKKGILPG